MTPTTRARTREAEAVLEHLAIAMLTDDQAMSSFIRWRTACGAVVAPSLHELVSVQAYVALIFQKVPA